MNVVLSREEEGEQVDGGAVSGACRATSNDASAQAGHWAGGTWTAGCLDISIFTLMSWTKCPTPQL